MYVSSLYACMPECFLLRGTYLFMSWWLCQYVRVVCICMEFAYVFFNFQNMQILHKTHRLAVEILRHFFGITVHTSFITVQHTHIHTSSVCTQL
jgi:hypothetical protein